MLRTQVLGFEGLYWVNKRGEVFNAKGKRMKPVVTRKGYHRLSLVKNKRKTNRTVHKIVCEAFIGERPKGYVCHHKDGNKRNNAFENLSYVSPLTNVRHAVLDGLTATGKDCSFFKNGKRIGERILGYYIPQLVRNDIKEVERLFAEKDAEIKRLKEALYGKS